MIVARIRAGQWRPFGLEPWATQKKLPARQLEKDKIFNSWLE